MKTLECNSKDNVLFHFIKYKTADQNKRNDTNQHGKYNELDKNGMLIQLTKSHRRPPDFFVIRYARVDLPRGASHAAGLLQFIRAIRAPSHPSTAQLPLPAACGTGTRTSQRSCPSVS